MKTWLLRWPFRFLLPTVLALATIPAALWLLYIQHNEYAKAVASDEEQYLRARLSVEQTRLEVQLGLGNRMQVQHLVSGLALQPNLLHAWLIDDDGRIIASTSRFELEQPWSDLIARLPSPMAQALVAIGEGQAPPSLTIQRVASADLLIGHVRIQPGHRLIAVSDLARPLAQRIASGHNELAFQITAPLFLVFSISLFFHFFWGKRIVQLTNAAEQLGRGRFSARAALSGHDELAEIGAAFDRMAARIEQQHQEIQRLISLLEQSPVVAIIWRNAPGWPVEFVSDNIQQWGFDKRALLSGETLYVDLIHPDDLPAIVTDVERHLTSGPDRYVQEYRLRDGFGHWRRIEDHTWLIRNEKKEVISIRGILLDVSSRKEAEEALRQRSEELAERNAELERFAQATIGRELEMIRLKREINDLLTAQGRPPAYPEVEKMEAGE